MIVSKTRNASRWLTQRRNLIPNEVKCNENVICVSVLRLTVKCIVCSSWVCSNFYVSYFVDKHIHSYQLSIVPCTPQNVPSLWISPYKPHLLNLMNEKGSSNTQTQYFILRRNKNKNCFFCLFWMNERIIDNGNVWDNFICSYFMVHGNILLFFKTV